MSAIGIFGGTFNPIHNGHLKIASSALEEYGLKKVIFLTSGNPPHKRGQNVLDAKIRHIMVKRAISGRKKFEACDWEINRKEPSYTLNTLKHFKEIMPDEQIYFIIGGDSLRDFGTWYKPEEILKLCTLLVYKRAGAEIEEKFAKMIHGESVDISSSQIRSMVKAGEDISEYVPKSTKEFIERNHLYENMADFEAKLKTMLTPERFEHSIGVRDTAVKMARIFGADEEKAAIAGLLHDNAKNLPDMLGKCEDLEVELDAEEKDNPALVHAKLGAETAKCEFGISDEEIINAIRWHTVGRPGMTTLEKIVFTADLTEPGRRFPDVEQLRKLAFSDLNRAVYECIKSTVEINKSRGVRVHPNAYKIMEELKKTP